MLPARGSYVYFRCCTSARILYTSRRTPRCCSVWPGTDAFTFCLQTKLGDFSFRCRVLIDFSLKTSDDFFLFSSRHISQAHPPPPPLPLVPPPNQSSAHKDGTGGRNGCAADTGELHQDFDDIWRIVLQTLVPSANRTQGQKVNGGQCQGTRDRRSFRAGSPKQPGECCGGRRCSPDDESTSRWCGVVVRGYS